MTDFTIIENGSATSPKGYVAGAAATGMKHGGAYDVALLVSENECAAAGVFTQSVVVAAPVIVDREVLAKNAGRMRGVVMNAKNANACTGQPGIEAARLMQSQAAALIGCEAEQLFVISTGVIGQQLPLDKIGQGIEISALNMDSEKGSLAARAFMTTDTFPKHLAVQVELSGGTVTIGGQAKGSGMIHPNMATMLGVVTTDADISAENLQRYLSAANNKSFNRISVDGDTSTNDTVLLLANGASGVSIGPKTQPVFGMRPNKPDEDTQKFLDALDHVCTELAKMIVRDGEGAKKFVEIQVSGLPDNADAHQVANTIATSPLVKTAFAGGDANWGRILAAAGRAGVEFKQDSAELHFSSNGDDWLMVLTGGTPTEYEEEEASAIFAETDIWLHLSLGRGAGQATVWTCDMTHEYISINADYRT